MQFLHDCYRNNNQWLPVPGTNVSIGSAWANKN